MIKSAKLMKNRESASSTVDVATLQRELSEAKREAQRLRGERQKAIDAAKQFLIDYKAQWPKNFEASGGYDIPFEKGFQQPPLPVLAWKPKLVAAPAATLAS